MELAVSDSHPVNRRDFILQSGAVAGVGVTGWVGIIREAVERSRAQNKPVLTETTFNSFVVDVRRQGIAASQAFVTAAQTDLPKAIRDRFAITSVQNNQLTAMSTTERAAVVAAIQRGFSGANELRVKLPGTMTAGHKGWTVSKTLKALDGATAEIWTVTATEKFP
jgi:hypothetical protein